MYQQEVLLVFARFLFRRRALSTPAENCTFVAVEISHFTLSGRAAQSSSGGSLLGGGRGEALPEVGVAVAADVEEMAVV